MNQEARIPIFGLTGTIGSGKSSVAALLEKKGALILDADLISREVVAPGSEGLSQIVGHFGEEILLCDGALDRKKLGKLVFSDPVQKSELEKILHPLIRQHYLSQLARLQKEIAQGLHKQAVAIVYVVPLLFESGYKYPEIKKTIVVSAPEQTCLERVMKRDSCSRDLARRKLSSQLSMKEKVKRADYVISNSGTEKELQAEVDRLVSTLRQQGEW